MEEFAIFVFDAYYINVYVKFDDFFPNSKKNKKAYPCANCQKNSPSGKRAICVLDDSKALVFSDVIKI